MAAVPTHETGTQWCSREQWTYASSASVESHSGTEYEKENRVFRTKHNKVANLFAVMSKNDVRKQGQTHRSNISDEQGPCLLRCRITQAIVRIGGE